MPKIISDFCVVDFTIFSLSPCLPAVFLEGLPAIFLEGQGQYRMSPPIIHSELRADPLCF